MSIGSIIIVILLMILYGGLIFLAVLLEEIEQFDELPLLVLAVLCAVIISFTSVLALLSH